MKLAELAGPKQAVNTKGITI